MEEEDKLIVSLDLDVFLDPEVEYFGVDGVGDWVEDLADELNLSFWRLESLANLLLPFTTDTKFVASVTHGFVVQHIVRLASLYPDITIISIDQHDDLIDSTDYFADNCRTYGFWGVMEWCWRWWLRKKHGLDSQHWTWALVEEFLESGLLLGGPIELFHVCSSPAFVPGNMIRPLIEHFGWVFNQQELAAKLLRNTQRQVHRKGGPDLLYYGEQYWRSLPLPSCPLTPIWGVHDRIASGQSKSRSWTSCA